MKIIQDTPTCFESEGVKIEYLTDKGFICEAFKKFADPNEIRAAKTRFLRMLAEFKPHYYLSDLTKFVGATSDSTAWVRDVWMPEICRQGMQGIAVVHNKDIFAEKSLHDVLIPQNLSCFKIKDAETYAEAEKWILAQMAQQRGI